VIFKGKNENRIYILISFLIILLIFVTVIFSSNDIFEAYIDDDILDKNWYEDVEGRFSDDRFFGLEKQISFMYRLDNSNYPSYLSVNSFKTFFMMNEDDLITKTIETIEQAAKEKNVFLDNNSKIQDSRVLKNGHKTMYAAFNGTILSNNITDKVKIIGETWNCKTSGTSIIVIGFAQTTNESNNFSNENLVYWAKIVKDKANTFGIYHDKSENLFIDDDGLIFNVRCHK
jgi:hypothetical protein